MGLNIKSIAADLSKQNNGDWVETEWRGVRLKVKSTNYKAYTDACDQAVLDLKKTLGRQPYRSESTPIINRLVGTFLLLDWEGIDEGTTPLPYTPEVGMQYVTDTAYQAFADQVIFAAMKVGVGEAKFNETAIKNSAAPSATI